MCLWCPCPSQFLWPVSVPKNGEVIMSVVLNWFVLTTSSKAKHSVGEGFQTASSCQPWFTARVGIWEQSRASPFLMCNQGSVATGWMCLFTVALKNVFANTCISAAKNSTRSHCACAARAGLELTSVRASAVLQRKKGNEMKIQVSCSYVPASPTGQIQALVQW